MSYGLHARPAFFKAHGLGNDYLVFREGEGWTVTSEAVRTVCDRWRGVGSDGIVVLLGSDEPPTEPFRLRMFNPDGGEFERSGNGLRVLAASLAVNGWVGDEPFRAEVGGDTVHMRIEARPGPGVFDVSVEMGATTHGPGAVALDESALADDGALDLADAGRVHPQCVSVGNPHAVHFGEPLTDARLNEVGPRVATHPGFREGTNVQLAEVRGPTVVDALIWERGVGVTASSGTSACAVAAAAVRTGRCPAGTIEVRMPGGSLWVAVTPELDVTLRGPVEGVCSGRLGEGFPGG